MFCHVAPLSVDRYIPDVPAEAKMLPPSETIDKTVPILGGEERVHDVPLFVDLNIPSSYVPAKIVPPISVRQRILIVSRLPVCQLMPLSVDLYTLFCVPARITLSFINIEVILLSFKDVCVQFVPLLEDK